MNHIYFTARQKSRGLFRRYLLLMGVALCLLPQAWSADQPPAPVNDPLKQLFDITYDEFLAQGLSQVDAMRKAMRVVERFSKASPAPAVAPPDRAKSAESEAKAGDVAPPVIASPPPNTVEGVAKEMYAAHPLVKDGGSNAIPVVVATNANETVSTDGTSDDNGASGKNGAGSQPGETKPFAGLTVATAGNAVATMLNEIRQGQSGAGSVYHLITSIANSNSPSHPARTKELMRRLNDATNAFLEFNKDTANALNGKQFTNDVEGLTLALEQELTPPDFTPRAFLHVGYVTLNPYKFVEVTDSAGVDRKKLEADSESSAIYVEFQYNNRWAWNWDEPAPAYLRRLNWANPFSMNSDMDLMLRFGYSFIDSGENEDIETSSIVGGGNISTEFVLGTPFLKYQNDWLRYSVDMETAYGMTSDRSVFDIHSTWMTGLGYYAAVQTPLFPGKVLVSAHLGLGFVEIPELDDGLDWENREVSFAELQHGEPAFKKRWGSVGLSMEVMLPLNRSTYVMGGGRLYANTTPNPWTAYIGISKDLASFGKFLMDDQPKK